MGQKRVIKKIGGKIQITGITFKVKRPKKPSLWNPLNWIPSIRAKKIKPTGKDL